MAAEKCRLKVEEDGEELLSIIEKFEEMAGHRLKEFEHLKGNKERVAFFEEIVGTDENKLFKIEKNFLEKSFEKADQYRICGNDLFKTKQFQSALKNYNLSVQFAPSNTELLATAFANRSAVYFHTSQYEQSLQDIDRSLSIGYASNLSYKLWNRKAKCLMALKSYRDCKDILSKYKRSLRSASHLTETELEKAEMVYEKEMEKCLRLIKTSTVVTNAADITITGNTTTTTTTTEEEEIVAGHPEIKISGGINPLIPQLSNSLTVKTSKTRGRHITTNPNHHHHHQLEIGEIVGAEKAFASILFEESTTHRCYGCLRRFKSPYPCRNCAYVLYCNEECERRSWFRYNHQYECQYQLYLRNTYVGRIGHLALRCFMQHDDDDDDDDTFQRHICTFLKHENERNMGINLQFTIIAKILYAICQRSNFVYKPPQPSPEKKNYVVDDEDDDGDKDNKNKNKNNHHHQTEISTMILNLLQICQCNAYCINEMTAGPFRDSKPRDIGIGLYKTATYFNHSCDPDVDINFYGSTAVFRLVKSRGKDEEASEAEYEICVDYGHVYCIEPLQMRQIALKSQYYFQCRCTACRENWPVYDYQESDVPTFKCQRCLRPLDITQLTDDKWATCEKCGTSANIVESLGVLRESFERYSRAVDRITMGGGGGENILNGDFGALKDIIGHLNLTQRIILEPFKDMTACQATVKQCFRLLANGSKI